MGARPSAHKLHVKMCVCVLLVCSADSIEANVESADVNVQSATQQLAQAAEYQVKHNRVKTDGKRK